MAALNAVLVNAPYAKIRPVGRFTFRVSVHSGMYVIDGWTVFGEKRAERKARKEFDRYAANKAREARFDSQERRIQ